MRLGTSVGLFSQSRGQIIPAPMVTRIEQCAAAGFSVIDLSFTNAIRPAKADPLAGSDWEAYIDEIGEAGARLGVDFSQAHLPYYGDLFSYDKRPDADFLDLFRKMTERSIIACGRLGVKWAVAHPFTDTLNAEWDNAVNLATNLEFYRPFAALAADCGTGLALENMAEFSIDRIRRRYCANTEELIALIDAFDAPDTVGACWDFGHANSVMLDQPAALRRLGSRLKATHVQDNTPTADAHLIPFIAGNIAWEEIVPVLREIGYMGDFVLESHNFTAQMPDALRPAAARLAYEFGMYCMNL